MSRPGRPRTFALLAIVLLVETFFAFYNPPYNNPDERSHMQCVAFYRDEGRLPDPYRESEKIQQDKHPPYTYVLGAVTLALTDGLFGDTTRRIRLPGPYQTAVRPGHLAVVRTDAASKPVADGQLYVLRLLIALHWVLAAFFLLKTADLVWPDRPRYAFALALAVAAIPQAAMSGAAVTPDTPLSAFAAATIYFTCCAALGHGSARRAGLVVGVWLALALLSKSAAVFLVPVALVAAPLRRHIKHDTWRFVGWVVVIPLAGAAWWYVRNLVLYGDLFQMRAQIEAYTHSIRREPLTGTYFEALFWDLFRTFFGFYDRSVLLPRPALLVLAGVVGVAVAGLCLLLRRAIRSEVPQSALHVLPLAATALVVLLGLVVAGNLTVPSAQGRYLYPALGAFMVATGTGLRVALRLRGDSRLPLWCVAAWLVFGLWAFHWSVLRRQAVSRARAHGEGGVLFYEDCGSPGLHPHQVQGYDAPDEGQLGRIVAWRTVAGHPDAVVYRFPITTPRALQVRVTYFVPSDPIAPYTAHEVGRFAYPTQRLRANGVLLHDDIELTSTPRELAYRVPRALVASGSLELRFEKRSGVAAAVAEIWIEEPWLVLEGRRLVNRSRRHLPWLVTWPGGVTGGEIARRGHVELPATVPADAMLTLSQRERAPWMWREAEAHPAPAVEWLGDMEASGGYRVHGTGLLAVLPFAALPEGPKLFLARTRTTRTWQLTAIPGAGEGAVEYRSPADVGVSLDYVLVCCGRPR